LLHVSSLGLVKYLWNNALDKVPDSEKKNLIDRLASVNTEGLGFGLLFAQPLVRHSGSLTGGDFCKTTQVAPFVLRPYVSDHTFQTWLAIAELQPLIWQLKIDNIANHCVGLFRCG
jgi:hypothetical protein